MLDKQMNKLKNIFKSFSEENTDNKKKTENMVVFVIILIITIIVINVILKNDKKENSDIQNSNVTKILAQKEIKKGDITEEYDLKEKLEDILSKVEGVGEVKVLITYSESSQVVALYNEDISKTDTEEKDSGGGNRKVVETANRKEVIYQEINGEKVPVTKSTIKPTIEGAVIIAKGASNSNVRLKIVQAVEAATGLPTHKIQVFEMKTS